MTDVLKYWMLSEASKTASTAMLTRGVCAESEAVALVSVRTCTVMIWPVPGLPSLESS